MKLSARFALLLMMAWLLGPRLGYAGVHPTPVDANTNCLECHADHAMGDHVHPAVQLGCTSCHTIENREDASYIVVKQSKTILCFECHGPEVFSYSHFPYALEIACDATILTLPPILACCAPRSTNSA